MTPFLASLALLCFAVPVYVYVGYPVLLWLWTRAKPQISHHRADMTPTVTLVISCYNEADVIGAKLDNALAMDYPPGKLQVIVVSDGSDDGTDAIVEEYSARGVVLIRQEGRLGKTMGLNLAMKQVTTEFVVFSDANAIYAADAIRKLMRNFADKTVGYVVGAAMYSDTSAGASARSEGLYWRYELAIKQWESCLCSVVGGDGAIYAIRSELWTPMDQKDINDFVNPLQIIARGYRGIFDIDARCVEETAGSFDKEVARKERIVNRSIRGLVRVRSVMNPMKTGVFAWQVISHKLLRWLIPFFLALGLAASSLLAASGLWPFRLITLGALMLVLLAWYGHRAEDKNQMPFWAATPYYFVMVNLYALRGIWSALRGHTQVTWQSARPNASDTFGNSHNKGGAPDILWPLSVCFLVVSLGLGYVG